MILIILCCIIVIMAILNAVISFRDKSLKLYRGQYLMWVIISIYALILTIQSELQVWP